MCTLPSKNKNEKTADKVRLIKLEHLKMTSIFKVQYKTLFFLSRACPQNEIHWPKGINNKSTKTISARTQTNRDLRRQQRRYRYL